MKKLSKMKVKRAPPGSKKEAIKVKRKLVHEGKVCGYRCGRCRQPKVGHTCTIEFVYIGKEMLLSSETRVQKGNAKSNPNEKAFKRKVKIYRCSKCRRFKAGHVCPYKKDTQPCARLEEEQSQKELADTDIDVLVQHAEDN